MAMGIAVPRINSVKLIFRARMFFNAIYTPSIAVVANPIAMNSTKTFKGSDLRVLCGTFGGLPGAPDDAMFGATPGGGPRRGFSRR